MDTGSWTVMYWLGARATQAIAPTGRAGVSTRPGTRGHPLRTERSGRVRGLGEPVGVVRRGELCVIAGKEGSLAWRDAEVTRVGVGDDRAGIVGGNEAFSDELV